MALRPCLDCNTPSLNTRCPVCDHRYQRTRNQQRPHYQGDWPALSRKLRAEWVANHGWVCPGWNTPAHPSTDLVADHIEQRNRDAIQVLCRSCNSRKSATERP